MADSARTIQVGQALIPQEIRPSYTVVLVTPEGQNRKALSEGVADDEIGQAVPVARRAYVFYARVMAKVLLPYRNIETLLGYAMAHELGHLMLPPNSHSTTGVMRPNFDTDPRVIPSFTRAEPSAIRERLRDDAQRMEYRGRTWGSAPT